MVVKEGNVFQFVLPSSLQTIGEPTEVAVNIWGDNFVYKGSERTKIKFKPKEPMPTKIIDLF